MAKSGFLSIVGLTHLVMGESKLPVSVPQQPTNDLMFYYVHSLIAATKVLLAIHDKQVPSNQHQSESPRIIENIAVDNLIYLCQGVFKMKEIGLWNNEQGSNWLDGGAPFYSIYTSKDKVFFTVACIEEKFYKNFLQALKELNMGNDTDYSYLLGNHLNEDEWPDMKHLIQTMFSKKSSKELEAKFSDKDCCVQRVMTEQQSLDSDLMKDIVIKDGKAKAFMTPVWKEMIKEIGLKRDILLRPPAKL